MKIRVKKGDCEIIIEDTTKNLSSIIDSVREITIEIIKIINETK
jgi:hypothetical protein